MKREDVKNALIEMCKRAVIKLPKDVVDSLEKAYEDETSKVAKMQLKAILDNIKLAEKSKKPMCQDTGVLIFYVDFGKEIIENMDSLIREAVLEATKTIPLRPNAVHPMTRKNPGNNVGVRMPHINYDFTKNEYTQIAVMPKGAGSENMSSLKMINPVEGLKGIKNFILDTVVNASGKPCPPIICGIGIGGSADIALKLAKRSLLRPLTERNSEREIARLEEELLEILNQTGIGPMGLGGKNGVLGVNIEYAFCHTASLPCAVNIQCWAARKSVGRFYEEGRIEIF
ncbi:MAG: fumarate hydratase [Candidatus Methanofastidiosia archaeon]